MATFHHQILQAALASQQALPSVPAQRVFVERTAPLEREDCPALNLNPGDSRAEVYGSDGEWDILKVRYQFTLAVHTRGDPQTALADPVIRDANAALMLDPSLGGLALRLSFVSSRPRKAGADGTAGVFELTFEATVLVHERTLQVWSQ